MAIQTNSGRLARIAIVFALSIVLVSCAHWGKSHDEARRNAEIESFYRYWKGTGYQYGGSSGQGIDCSALMVEAYHDIFKINLPRTTEDQSDLGKRVRLKKIQSGDLVFFKTGITRRHVGMYAGDGYFVHASGSGGVMKSSLNSGYWKDHFWKVKRVAKY